jgi:phage anti-repressor protein
MSNIYDLKQEILERKYKRHQIYETIYEKITSKIKFTNSNTHNCYCIYKFKIIEYGLPSYDINECISYVSEKLRKNHFKVGLIANNSIIISWLHILEQQSKKERELNANISLIDMKEREMLQQNNKIIKMQMIDNAQIKSSSHFGDTLQNFPLYNIPKMKTLDYTLPLNSTKMIDMKKKNPIEKQVFNAHIKNKKSQQDIQSSLELDKLLSQFDNTNLF